MPDSDRGEDFGHWIVGGAIVALAIGLFANWWAVSRISDDVYQQSATSDAYSKAEKVFEAECADLPTSEKKSSSAFEKP